MNHKSYILASCFFQFAGPIIVIVGCYFFIVKAVFNHEEELRGQAKKMKVTSLRSINKDQELAVSAEIRAAKVAVVNILLWIFAWAPFTTIAMVGTWYDASFVTPLMSELPIICAKTSALYNPVIYALSHPKYRECLKELYPWLCIMVDERKPVRGRNGDSSSAVTSIKTETSSE
jgi:r-opsin